MGTVVLRNAELINEGRRLRADVLLRDGRIERIGSLPAGTQADQEYDLTGKLLLPGLIDDQVHFREPGLTHKACIASEARAAVAGGVTSFMEMPNTSPPATTLEELEKKYAIGAATSTANYSFFFGATNTNLDSVKRVDARKVCGVKVFMGSSTGDMLVDAAATLEGIFRHSPTLIATHCEDTPMIKLAEAAAKAKWGDDVPASEHGRIRSVEACYASSSMAAELARRHDARLHILHITTAKELSLFSAAPLKGKRLTAEACVHHLWFAEEDYARLGHQIKCNPAIKTSADRAAVRAAVASGVIDVIATDHAPHTREEKAQTYFKAPSGLPLVQHSLVVLMDLVQQGEFTLETAVERACHAPAILFGVEKRGFIREGYWADLVVVNPKKPYTVKAENVLYQCGWSPLEGHTFSSSIERTFVNGVCVFENGQMRADAPKGQRLTFNGNAR
ncbi:MAG: dihydroorotase [Verrucomicrobia bacterium]|nr:dihydroorotase [Verrucomicrobiota bacterium]